MPTDTHAQEAYFHPKNISQGQARILYAKECVDVSGNLHEEGWILPGGSRTQSFKAAHAAAMHLNTLMGGAA